MACTMHHARAPWHAYTVTLCGGLRVWEGEWRVLELAGLEEAEVAVGERLVYARHCGRVDRKPSRRTPRVDGCEDACLVTVRVKVRVRVRVRVGVGVGSRVRVDGCEGACQLRVYTLL